MSEHADTVRDYWHTLEVALTALPHESPYRDQALATLEHLRDRVISGRAALVAELEEARRNVREEAEQTCIEIDLRKAAEAERDRYRDALGTYRCRVHGPTNRTAPEPLAPCPFCARAALSVSGRGAA